MPPTKWTKDNALCLSYTPTFEPDMLPGEKNLGVCFSGGGARFCSTGVGVLRGLHERGLLSKIDLMSVVSGGAFAVCGFFSFMFEKRAAEKGVKVGDLSPFVPTDDEITAALDHLDNQVDTTMSGFFIGKRFLFSTITGLITSVVVWLSVAWFVAQAMEHVAGSCMRDAVKHGDIMSQSFSFDCLLKPWVVRYPTLYALCALVAVPVASHIGSQVVDFMGIKSRHIGVPLLVLGKLISVVSVCVVVWDVVFRAVCFVQAVLAPFVTESINAAYELHIGAGTLKLGLVLLLLYAVLAWSRSMWLTSAPVVLWAAVGVLLFWWCCFRIPQMPNTVNMAVVAVSGSVLAYYSLSAANKHRLYTRVVSETFMSPRCSVELGDLSLVKKPTLVLNATCHNVCGCARCSRSDAPANEPLPAPHRAHVPRSREGDSHAASYHVFQPVSGDSRPGGSANGGLLWTAGAGAGASIEGGACMWPCVQAWDMESRSLFLMNGSVTGAPGLGFRRTDEFIGHWPLAEAVAVSASFWTGVVELSGAMRSIGGRFSLFLYNWTLGRWVTSPALLPMAGEWLFVLSRVPWLRRCFLPVKAGSSRRRQARARLDAFSRLVAWHSLLYETLLLAAPTLAAAVAVSIMSLPLSIAVALCITAMHFVGLWSAGWKRVLHFMSWFANHYMVLGVNTSDCPVHYLSDGAHLDNLGLTTALMARCRDVVVFDGTFDSEGLFDDLFKSMEVCERRLGVTFAIDESVATLDDLRPGADSFANKMAIKLDATYPDGATAAVWYVKTTVLTRSVPVKQRLYALNNSEFPNHSTIDAYDSQRYRAYRDLGRHAANALADVFVFSH